MMINDSNFNTIINSTINNAINNIINTNNKTNIIPSITPTPKINNNPKSNTIIINNWIVEERN